MVNTKHDTTSYENCSYKHEIFNSDFLYQSFIDGKRGSSWKPQVQNFEMNLLIELSNLKQDIENKTLKLLPSNDFILSERGKTRLISGEHIRDRVVKRCLCEYSLLPKINKYLIHDNGASLKNKGIGFSRKRLDTHLRKYYKQNNTNEGYILLIDFSKYFDNIKHKYFIDIFKNIGIDDTSLWILEKIVDKSKIDVSYMCDEDYLDCMNVLFDSLQYQNIDSSLLTKEKFMNKHLNIGDHVAQVAGIAYPIKFDNYIKIVKSIKFFGRYMDDSYIIHKDKEFLVKLLDELVDICRDIGLTINLKKTRICKLSDNWKFLQIKYSLTNTGRIIKRINPKRLTSMRKKLKKLAGKISLREFENLYNSWFNNHYKIMSKQQRLNMNELFSTLKKECYGEDNIK